MQPTPEKGLATTEKEDASTEEAAVSATPKKSVPITKTATPKKPSGSDTKAPTPKDGSPAEGKRDEAPKDGTPAPKETPKAGAAPEKQAETPKPSTPVNPPRAAALLFAGVSPPEPMDTGEF